MILVNTDFISGRELETLGLVKGSTIQSKNMGADGIVNIRYASSAIMQNAAEVIAYGTAVRFK
jgi:uncharacterized protein YbjQ (UPF0145 family)